MPEEKVRKRKGIVHINHIFCKRCGICVNYCPVQNLVLKENMLFELEKCIACRMCQRYCPDIAIEVEDINGQTAHSG